MRRRIFGRWVDGKGWRLVILALLTVGACSGSAEISSSSEKPGDPEGSVSEIAAVSSDGVVTVLVAPGEDLQVDVTVRAVDPSPILQAAIDNGFAVFEYELGPDGHVFDNPVTVEFRIELSDLEPGLSPLPLFAIGTSSDGASYETMTDVSIRRDGSAVVVSGSTTHFSHAAVAISVTPIDSSQVEQIEALVGEPFQATVDLGFLSEDLGLTVWQYRYNLDIDSEIVTITDGSLAPPYDGVLTAEDPQQVFTFMCSESDPDPVSVNVSWRSFSSPGFNFQDVVEAGLITRRNEALGKSFGFSVLCRSGTDAPIQTLGSCWPPEGERPVLANYEIYSVPMEGRPRELVGGPGGTVWIHQTETGSVVVLDMMQQPVGSATFEGVGIPRSNGDLVVFHTAGEVQYTRSADEPATLIVSAAADETDFIQDAYPVGNGILVSRTSGYYRYDLDGNELWSLEHPPSESGGAANQTGSLVPGDGAFWGADNRGNLYRIPKDGSAGATYPIADAVWAGEEKLRPVPTLLPVHGGVWITNADDSMVFVADDGTVGDRVVVGPPPSGDGQHIVPVRSVRCGSGFIWVESDGDPMTIRFSLDDPTDIRMNDADPVLVTAGIEWRAQGSEVFALDVKTRQRLGTWPLENVHFGEPFVWVGDSLWVNDGARGLTYQIRAAP